MGPNKIQSVKLGMRPRQSSLDSGGCPIKVLNGEGAGYRGICKVGEDV